MKWFKSHKKSTFIGIILLILIVIIAVSYGNSGSSSPLGRGIKTVLTTIQEPFAKAGKGIGTAFKGIVQFKAITRENEALKDEIARLNNEIINLKLSEEELQLLQSLSTALNYENVRNYYNYITGDVIAMDGSNWFNIFTVNLGSKDGVKRDTVVINGQGLIGRVMEVGSNWAKVISIIDESNSVSFKATRDGSLMGVMAGDGQGGLRGYMLNPDFEILEGDELITTGMGMFPEGIPIGTVSRIALNEDSLLKAIQIKPSANLDNVQKVIFIIPKDEGEVQ